MGTISGRIKILMNKLPTRKEEEDKILRPLVSPTVLPPVQVCTGTCNPTNCEVADNCVEPRKKRYIHLVK